MSEHDKLPTDLIALEARLAELRPSEAKLDRDTLFYEAGFQAGLLASATHAEATKPQLALGARRDSAGEPHAGSLAPGASQGFASRVIFASLASAATAACLAVFVTRAILAPAQLPESNSQVASDTGEASDLEEVRVVEKEQHAARAEGYEASPREFPWKHFTQQTSMLAMRNAILSGEEIPSTRATSLVSTEFDPPKSARQLRAELLPRREVPTSFNGWQWLENFRTQGEAI